jgi:hypothetical protein
MFDYFAKKMMDIHGYSFDMLNSPFAFPRLPPRSNAPLGISGASRIKDAIVHDSNIMMGKLFDHHQIFQRYAAGLFELSPGQFTPGHPMHMKTYSIDTLHEENARLKKENYFFKTEHNKEKKK